jgi:hypothetical protein
LALIHQARRFVMPRDWTREERGRGGRRERWEERRDWREPSPRKDFGQADFSSDYGYDPERRSGYRAADEAGRRADDYGQADYSTDFAYDPQLGRGYRRFSDEDRDYVDRDDADRVYVRREAYDENRRGPPDDDRDERERERGIGERGRSWVDRAGAFFAGRDEAEPRQRRRWPSDRVLWAVIVERLEDERGLDLRDVEVLVDDAEVTLNGTVRRKEDKRRIEDIADIQGVRHVQNNLRARAARRWFG